MTFRQFLVFQIHRQSTKSRRRVEATPTGEKKVVAVFFGAKVERGSVSEKPQLRLLSAMFRLVRLVT